MNDSNLFVGIDFHKRCSVISAQDAQGGRLLECAGTAQGGGTAVTPPVRWRSIQASVVLLGLTTIYWSSFSAITVSGG